MESLLDLGVPVEIKYYHLLVYPEDKDDTAFVSFTENGKATHLLSYNKHLLDLQYRHVFDFTICKITDFLGILTYQHKSSVHFLYCFFIFFVPFVCFVVKKI